MRRTFRSALLVHGRPEMTSTARPSGGLGGATDLTDLLAAREKRKTTTGFFPRKKTKHGFPRMGGGAGGAPAPGGAPKGGPGLTEKFQQRQQQQMQVVRAAGGEDAGGGRGLPAPDSPHPARTHARAGA